MQFAAEDSSLVAIMETLQPLQLSDFGVQDLFLIDDSLLLEPVDHIATLGSCFLLVLSFSFFFFFFLFQIITLWLCVSCPDDFQTPVEKLFCIRDSINLLLRAVERHFKAKEDTQGGPSQDGQYPAISTDDLLPLFIYVIIKSHPVHLYSNFFYMKTFQFSDIAKHSDIGWVTLLQEIISIGYGLLINLPSFFFSAGSTSAPFRPLWNTCGPVVSRTSCSKQRRGLGMTKS